MVIVSHMTQPLISVIIATYNRAAMLLEAVQSVRQQSFHSWELIVVDDGSTDNTLPLLGQLEEPRLRILRAAHSGNPARVRNLGLANAFGRYVAFLDDDDLWRPEKLARQLTMMTRGDRRWSYTGFVRVDPSGQPVWATPPESICSGAILESLLEVRAAVALPTVLAERSLINDAGRFNEAMRTREDYALWLELAERADVAAHPERLTIVRDHPGRVFRPEGRRMSVVLYTEWFLRLTDRRLRRICRRRIAHAYLQDARYRVQVRHWRDLVVSLVGALRWDPILTVRRLLSAIRGRLVDKGRTNVARGPEPPHG